MYDYMAEQDTTRKLVPWNYDGTLIAYHDVRMQYEKELRRIHASVFSKIFKKRYAKKVKTLEAPIEDCNKLIDARINEIQTWNRVTIVRELNGQKL